MNIKEVAEIRRRFKVERTNISRIRGALINEKKEVISRFDQSLNLISEEEAEAILKILKRTLSGSLNKQLTDISFTNQQVLDSSEHKMLSALKASSLSDDKALEELIESVRISYKAKGNYLIILGSDAYDVPSYGSDGKKEDSGEVYSYIVCAICPLDMTKSTLGYKLTENVIKNNLPDWVIGSPDAGFLFPAFDGRKTNIYNALFYNRDKKDSRAELIEALFRREAPMALEIQKQVFTNIFRDTIADDCSIDVVKEVQGHLGQLIEEHKALKDPEPLTVSKTASI